MMQVSTFADMEGEESFDSSLLGYADEVVEERIADDDVILIKGTKTTSAVSNLFYFEFGFSLYIYIYIYLSYILQLNIKI